MDALFSSAGIVMDLGGMLSHGSIIAREYGIPAVVNVGPATQIIQTGQWLEVDANKGVVKILDRAPETDDEAEKREALEISKGFAQLGV